MSERPCFIVNPNSAGGQTGRLWDISLREQIVRRFPTARWALTTRERQASRLAERAWKQGADLVVAVGGDGSVNEVVNGLMANSLGDLEAALPEFQGAEWSAPEATPPQPVLGLLPRGTGCDLARSLAVPKNLIGALSVLENGRTVEADVGEIEFTAREDLQPQKRYFFNIAGCGANGEVVARVNRSNKRLGGFLSFLLATLATTMRYHRPLVKITVDEEAPRTVDLNVLFVCNAQYCGGGMHVGADALIHDGLFSVVEISATSRLQSLIHGGKLYTGQLAGLPGTRAYHARRIRITSSEEVLVECDGEQPGILPASYTLLDHALRVRVGDHATAVQLPTTQGS